MLTTFIIPSIRRPSLQRAIESVGSNPYLVGYDDEGGHRADIRNQLIQQAKTPWVSFLDDDDIVLPWYVSALEAEIKANPEVGLIHFREYFTTTGRLLPSWPRIAWGDVGISFSVKRDVALAHPFIEEPYEDLCFVQRVEKAGVTVHFSRELVYIGRPGYLVQE